MLDVLSVQGYGLWSGPTDRRLRQTTINYQRHLWIRDMMVANGDANKPIWISEAGWDPVPDDPAIADAERYGRVTMEQAAEWAPLAYERAQEEWPWIGVVTWWYFKRADYTASDQSWFYFQMVDPDFQPTPVYDALKAYITGQQPKTLGAGWHGVGARGVTGTTESGLESRTFRFAGTGVYVCPAQTASASAVTYTLDGSHTGALLFPAESAACVEICTSLAPGEHTLTLVADDWSAVDGFVVVDFTGRGRLPWLLAGALAALGAGIVIGRAGWLRLRRPESEAGG